MWITSRISYCVLLYCSRLGNNWCLRKKPWLRCLLNYEVMIHIHRLQKGLNCLKNNKLTYFFNVWFSKVKRIQTKPWSLFVQTAFPFLFMALKPHFLGFLSLQTATTPPRNQLELSCLVLKGTIPLFSLYVSKHNPSFHAHNLYIASPKPKDWSRQ